MSGNKVVGTLLVAEGGRFISLLDLTGMIMSTRPHNYKNRVPCTPAGYAAMFMIQLIPPFLCMLDTRQANTHAHCNMEARPHTVTVHVHPY